MKIETFTDAVPNMSTSLFCGIVISLVVVAVYLVILKRKYSRSPEQLGTKGFIAICLIFVLTFATASIVHKVITQTFYAQAKMSYSDKQKVVLAENGFMIKDVKKPVTMTNSSWYSAFPDQTEEAVMVLDYQGRDYTCDVKPKNDGFLEFKCTPANLSLEEIKVIG